MSPKAGCLIVVSVVFCVSSIVVSVLIGKEQQTPQTQVNTPVPIAPTPAIPVNPVQAWIGVLQRETGVTIEASFPVIHITTNQCNRTWLPAFLAHNDRDNQLRRLGITTVRCGLDPAMDLIEYRTIDSLPLASLSEANCLWSATTRSENTPEDRTLETETIQREAITAGLRSVRVEATGTRNRTMHISGVDRCDDSTLRRIFPTVRGYVGNFQIFCTINGFHGIECTPNHGQTRVIDYASACRCTSILQCQCLF